MEVNTRPLLQGSESDSENSNEIDNSEIVISDNNTSDTRGILKTNEPIDKYRICYIIFYLLGITTLIPWNFFITADDYWMYKFRNVSQNENVTLKVTPGNRTPLQKEFTSYISICSAVPNSIFLILSPVINKKLSLPFRMIVSLVIIIWFFIVTTVFVNIDTDNYQDLFFQITLFSVVILNVFSAILSGSIFGILGRFSPAYITAIVSGQALGGIFTSIVQILSLALGESSVHAAFVYFMIGNGVLILTLISYCILSRSVFFNYYLNLKPSEDVSIQNDYGRNQQVSYKVVLKKIWLYGVSEWFVFVVTLSIYPAVTVLIESEDKGSGNQWNDLYFVPVVCYLIFNSGDYIGRLAAGYFQWPHQKGALILALNFTRLAFIPLFLFCNAQPRHHLPVLMREDFYYILIMCFFSFTNGYLANIAVICAPRAVHHHEKEVASAMMAAFLGVGLSVGSLLSLFMVKII